MLAESMDERRLLSIVNDDRWALEPKVDGHRCLVVIDLEGEVRFVARSGMDLNIGPARPLVIEALALLRNSGAGFVLDGEWLGPERTLWVFDLPEAGDLINLNTPFADRRAALEAITYCNGHVRLLPSHRDVESKSALVRDVKSRNAEGVIARRIDAPYRPGRSRHLLKYKFRHDVDCVVSAVGVGGHDNIALSLWDPTNERLVEVGHCSALTGSGRTHTFEIGDVVKVTCLYVTDDNNLYQPTLPTLRDDKAPRECTIDQLELFRPDKRVVPGS